MIPPRDLPLASIVKQFAVPGPTGVSLDTAWLGEFQSWLETSYERLIHDARSPGLHASGLGRVCARRLVLIETFGAAVESHKGGNLLTFDIGHAMHFWWQHRYLGPKQELWGDWICVACPCPACESAIGRDSANQSVTVQTVETCAACRGTRRKLTRGLMPMNCECGVDWRDAIKFIEMPVVDTKLGYVGHTDGLIIKKDGKKRVFEFKTSGPNDFPELVAPKKDHIIQAHAYMRKLGTDEALIVYQDKGKQCDWSVDSKGNWRPGSLHIKPYVVHYDPLVWDPIERRIFDHHEARSMLQAILDEGRRPTPTDVHRFARVCSSPKVDLARDCPVRTQCFMIQAIGSIPGP